MATLAIGTSPSVRRPQTSHRLAAQASARASPTAAEGVDCHYGELSAITPTLPLALDAAWRDLPDRDKATEANPREVQRTHGDILPRMKIAMWYHAYVDGDWTEPVLEHVEALHASEFSGPVYLGLVGAKFWRDAARGAFAPLDARVAVEADSGFEQVTLAKVREYAQSHEGAIAYAHTKGSQDVTDFRAKWRRSMTRLVINDWRANLAHLEGRECEECGGSGEVHYGEPEVDVYAEGMRECSECDGEGKVGGFDAVGCHWLTAEQFSSWAPQEFPDGTPFFGGNFWMARCDYLRTLPEPSTRSRFDAERWIGLGDPRVLDLLPGWPAANLFV